MIGEKFWKVNILKKLVKNINLKLKFEGKNKLKIWSEIEDEKQEIYVVKFFLKK